MYLKHFQIQYQTFPMYSVWTLQSAAVKRPQCKNFSIFKTAQLFYTKFSHIINKEICYRQTTFGAIL